MKKLHVDFNVEKCMELCVLSQTAWLDVILRLRQADLVRKRMRQ